MGSSSTGLGDEGGGLVGSSDSRVENDRGVMGLLEPVVAVLAALEDPVREGSANEGVDNVADVRSWHLADLSDYGESVDDVLVAEAEVKDGVHGELLVLGNSDYFDLVVEDGLQNTRSIEENIPFSWKLPSPSSAR